MALPMVLAGLGGLSSFGMGLGGGIGYGAGHRIGFEQVGPAIINGSYERLGEMFNKFGTFVGETTGSMELVNNFMQLVGEEQQASQQNSLTQPKAELPPPPPITQTPKGTGVTIPTTATTSETLTNPVLKEKEKVHHINFKISGTNNYYNKYYTQKQLQKDIDETNSRLTNPKG